MALVNAPQVEMEESLCGCFDDFGDCVFALCCAPCHLGKQAEKTRTGDCLPTCIIGYLLEPTGLLGCLYMKYVLDKALKSVGVTKDIDWLTCCCCNCCVQCQVAREIKNRQAKMAVAGGVPAPQVVVVHAPAPVAASK